jgi:hypothetical protein
MVGEEFRESTAIWFHFNCEKEPKPQRLKGKQSKSPLPLRLSAQSGMRLLWRWKVWGKWGDEMKCVEMVRSCALGP